MHRELKERAAFTAKLDAFELLEYSPKTGRHYDLANSLADAVLRPRGARSLDVAQFQQARAVQRLTEDEREELKGAIRAELFVQRDRTEKLARILGSWYGVTPKWVNQFRIKRKGREIAKACRAGRAVLSYGLHGEKADSATFSFVALPESLRHAETDRAVNWDRIRRGIVSKLAAHYSARRGGRAHFRKDAATLRRVIELIVTAEPENTDALAAHLDKSKAAFWKMTERMGERLADGAARLAYKRNLRVCLAASIPPAARPVVALVDVPATLTERMQWDEATDRLTPYARAVVRGDAATLRRYSAHRASWPLAGEYVTAHPDSLAGLAAFYRAARP